MGKTCVWPLFKMLAVAMPLSAWKGQTVGADAMMVIHACADRDRREYVLSRNFDLVAERVLAQFRLLRGEGMTAVCVIDGPIKHAAKADTDNERSQARSAAGARVRAAAEAGTEPSDDDLRLAAHGITDELKRAVVHKLRSDGFEVDEAPSEADGQLALRSWRGDFHALLMADADAVFLGAKEILTEWMPGKKTVKRYRLDDILRGGVPAPAEGGKSAAWMHQSCGHRLGAICAKGGLEAFRLYALYLNDYYHIPKVGPGRMIESMESVILAEEELTISSVVAHLPRATVAAVAKANNVSMEDAHVVLAEQMADARSGFLDQLVHDGSENVKLSQALSNDPSWLCYMPPPAPPPLLPRAPAQPSRVPLGGVRPSRVNQSLRPAAKAMREAMCASMPEPTEAWAKDARSKFLASGFIPRRPSASMVGGAALIAPPAEWGTSPPSGEACKAFLLTRDYHGLDTFNVSELRELVRKHLALESERGGEINVVDYFKARNVQEMLIDSHAIPAAIFPQFDPAYELPAGTTFTYTDADDIRKYMPIMHQSVIDAHFKDRIAGETLTAARSERDVLKRENSSLARRAELLIGHLAANGTSCAYLRQWVVASMNKDDKDPYNRATYENTVCMEVDENMCVLEIKRAWCFCKNRSSGTCIHTFITCTTMHIISIDAGRILTCTGTEQQWHKPRANLKPDLELLMKPARLLTFTGALTKKASCKRPYGNKRAAEKVAAFIETDIDNSEMWKRQRTVYYTDPEARKERLNLQVQAAVMKSKPHDVHIVPSVWSKTWDADDMLDEIHGADAFAARNAPVDPNKKYRFLS